LERPELFGDLADEGKPVGGKGRFVLVGWNFSWYQAEIGVSDLEYPLSIKQHNALPRAPAYLFGRFVILGNANELRIVVLRYVVEKKLSGCWMEIEIALVRVRETLTTKNHIIWATEGCEARGDFCGLVQADPQEPVRDVVRAHTQSLVISGVVNNLESFLV
jgi:hypothetical protein